MNEPSDAQRLADFRDLHIGDVIAIGEDGSEWIENLEGVLIPAEEWHAQFGPHRSEKPAEEPEPTE